MFNTVQSAENKSSASAYICAVCSAKISTPLCTDCGFDNSCNYEQYPTLQKIEKNTPSISHLKSQRNSNSKPSVEEAVAFLRHQGWEEYVISAAEKILKRAAHGLFTEQHFVEITEKSGVGKTLILGSYPQDNSESPAGIEWEVIDIIENQALLLSKKCLDTYPYNKIKTETTWQYSDLREWLNNQFLNSAFSTKDQSAIISKAVSPSQNPRSNVTSGTTTIDRVFILSHDELAKYNLSKDKIICPATKHAIAKGIFRSSKTTNSYWWLRTPGYTNKSAIYVTSKGNFDELGDAVNSTNKGIRPALWVDLEKINI